MSKNMILEKLEGIKDRFDEVSRELSDPATMSDMKHYIKLNKEYKELEPIINAYKEYKELLSNIDTAKQMLTEEKDEEMREMAKQEMDEWLAKREPLEEKIKLLLIPADPQDKKNAIVEIRAGTGGDEASIFAGDLFRMYSKFAENKGWKIEINRFTEGTVGGYKEIVFTIKGDGVYGIMKY